MADAEAWLRAAVRVHTQSGPAAAAAAVPVPATGASGRGGEAAYHSAYELWLTLARAIEEGAEEEGAEEDGAGAYEACAVDAAATRPWP